MAAAVVGGATALRFITPQALRLVGARIITNSKVGATIWQLGLVVAGTAIYFKAYDIADQLAVAAFERRDEDFRSHSYE